MSSIWNLTALILRGYDIGTDHHIAGLGNLIEWTTTAGQNAVEETEYTTAPQRGKLAATQKLRELTQQARHAWIRGLP